MSGEVTTTGEFLALAQRWQWYYNVERPHFGAGMEGRTLMEKLRELGLDLPNEFAAFPAILLDEVAVIWASKGGHCVGLLQRARLKEADLEPKSLTAPGQIFDVVAEDYHLVIAQELVQEMRSVAHREPPLGPASGKSHVLQECSPRYRGTPASKPDVEQRSRHLSLLDLYT